MSKPAGKCIFCGGGKLSKEHVFPQWMDGVLPSIANETQRHTVSRPGTHGETWSLGKINRPVPFRKMTLRVVCRTCNNEWMAVLQSAAKPALSRIMLGDRGSLTSDEAETLSRWAVMTVMVSELADPGTSRITQNEREAFARGEILSADWLVFVAVSSLPHVGLRYHAAGELVLQTGERKDWIVDSMRIGKAVLHVIRAIPVDDSYAMDLRLWRILPATEPTGTLSMLNETEVGAVLDTLRYDIGLDISDQYQPPRRT